MTKHFHSVYLVFAALIILAACKESKYKGFKETESGLYYKFVTSNKDGVQPQDSSYLDVTLSYYIAETDSLFFTSKDIPGGKMKIGLFPSAYRGDIMEGIRMMHVGDSAIFITSIDSFFIKTAQGEVPPELPKGKDIKIAMKLIDIQTIAQRRAMQKKQVDENTRTAQANMEMEPELIADYINRKNITAKPTATGLYYIENTKGNGPKAKKGQKVTVHYSGFLLNGKKFDSSYDRDQPFTFTLGAGEVIGGWDEGVSYMNVGTFAQFLLPSQLAYGAMGSPPVIPPFSPLVFEVQLLKIENQK
jgi:FKBP-type peptidyl-prolyl cis-trans isomerase FkpA